MMSQFSDLVAFFEHSGIAQAVRRRHPDYDDRQVFLALVRRLYGDELALEVWPEVRHFVTAELRLRAGLDAEPVGLGDQVLTNFDDIVRYRHTP